MFFAACTEDKPLNNSSQVDEMDSYWIDENGDLQINFKNHTAALEINALQDSIILVDDQQRLLILTDPSDQYQHGILGDSIEATSVTIIHLSDEPYVINKFSIPEDWVIESIKPLWSDWDDDGNKEIVLTLSNSTDGSKIVLYDESGNSLAESAPIGIGYRWRHVLGIAPFAEDGQKLLVDVQTPHIGGIVNYYSWDKENNVIKVEASLSGYSTHDIGSRDMHMYLLTLNEENQQTLLIVPTQSKKELVALRYRSGTIHEEWTIALGGKLTGNLSWEGDDSIGAVIDDNQKILLETPK